VREKLGVIRIFQKVCFGGVFFVTCQNNFEKPGSCQQEGEKRGGGKTECHLKKGRKLGRGTFESLISVSGGKNHGKQEERTCC